MHRPIEFLTAQSSQEFGHLPQQRLGHLLEDYQQHVMEYHDHVREHGDILDDIPPDGTAQAASRQMRCAEQRYLSMVLSVYHGELARRIEGGKQQILDILREAAVEFDARVREGGTVVPTTQEILQERQAAEKYPTDVQGSH